MVNGRPDASEYPERLGRYLELVPESDIGSTLVLQHEQTMAFVGAIPQTLSDHRYAPGKWTTREVFVALLRHLPEEAWARTGTVSGLPMSVRAIAYAMVGHERHHLNIIQTKYLPSI